MTLFGFVFNEILAGFRDDFINLGITFCSVSRKKFYNKTNLTFHWNNRQFYWQSLRLSWKQFNAE